jgi:hypothetical protein
MPWHKSVEMSVLYQRMSCVASVMPSRAIAVRVGYVKCEYCATSQARPDDGKCRSCGGRTPHQDEMYVP